MNTHKQVELIIIDHASTDNTAEIVAKHKSKGDINHIRRDKNYTFSESCNFGATKAKHPYLLFLNDDIIYTDDVLGKALEMLGNEASRKSVDLQLGGSTLTLHRRSLFDPSSLTCAGDIVRPKASLPSVVLFWKQNDTTIYGRRHEMVAKYLASRADISKVLVLDAPIAKNMLERFSKDESLTQHKLVYERTCQKLIGLLDTDKLLYRVYFHNHADPGQISAEYLQYIRQTLTQADIEPGSSIFWFYPSVDMAEEIIDHFQPACVVTDIVDDHRAWPDVSKPKKEQFTAHYKAVLGKSQFALCNCAPVQEAMRGFFKDIRLLPNACDPAPPASPVNDPLFTRLAAKKRPVIGFVGNLEKKIDQPLLEALATSFPDTDIVLIGSTHMNPEILALDKHPHVHFPGVVPYDQAGTWISLFDAAIIPHRNMDLTRNMNPLKLYSYLAWNVPVVCTDIPNIDKSSGMVFMAKTHDEFIQHVRNILDKKVKLPDIASWRQSNCWSSRLAEHVNDVLDYVKRTPLHRTLVTLLSHTSHEGLSSETLRQENELLLLQLYQVQGQLEEYYLKYQKLNNSVANAC